MALHLPVSGARRAWLKSALALGATTLAAPLWAAPAAGGEPVRIALIESLSGPFANTGEAVYRNLLWATERVNARGGIALPGGARKLVVERFDSKGQVQEALQALRAAIDAGARVITQGNSSAVAAALVDAVEKHNAREPQRQVLFLNYSAVEPELTNRLCSFWHFRFDAHADMRMSALMEVVRADTALKRIYLIGQDYSFGQATLREARRQLAAQRPDVQIVGEQLHPIGRVKDFLPYVTKIKASGAQAVFTGNWGNDLTLLVKAAREIGFDGMFYTFYANALGAPAAIGDAGVGRVLAVAEWMPNVDTPESAAFYQAFRQRFSKSQDDYVHMRMQLMIEALAQAMQRAQSVEALPVARALEQAKVTLAARTGVMRAQDHQFQQPLVVGMMERKGAPGVPFDVEDSGYGFRIVREIAPEQAELPTSCQMKRPG
ncbi:MAG: branched-chain amino acid ABC transporter substrate-binding protein [Burkholderiaceae bacterium]|jgi:branched-chain amino acid transport system substrate-binding protein|nr:branched-chain amino acid ABC transporter substrate-binding protein [Burkholderiaceae bacterium]